MKPGSRRRDGFSLLDVLATLTIVAIAGTVAVPLIHRSVEASRLRAGAWTVAQDLHRTRARAIRDNQSHRLTLSATELDPESGNPVAYTIAPADGSGVAVERAFPEGIECRNAPGSWIEFDARGLAHGASMGLELEGAGSARKTVRVRSTGRVDFPG